MKVASPCRRQAGRYELRLLQQTERHAGEAADMVAKATAETEAALVERLDQRSQQVAEDNRRLEGYLRMRSKVIHDCAPCACARTPMAVVHLLTIRRL